MKRELGNYIFSKFLFTVTNHYIMQEIDRTRFFFRLCYISNIFYSFYEKYFIIIEIHRNVDFEFYCIFTVLHNVSIGLLLILTYTVYSWCYYKYSEYTVQIYHLFTDGAVKNNKNKSKIHCCSVVLVCKINSFPIYYVFLDSVTLLK